MAKGPEGFALRSVAKRAGVSHAAPAHHFGDAGGLLTALAAEAFVRFRACQERREAAVTEGGARARLVAAGLGYVDFAMTHPALFRLIFSSDRPDFADPALARESEAAYRHLAEQVAEAGGGAAEVAAVWAMAHGLADLLSAGRLKALGALDGPARDAALAALLGRAMPA